MEHIPLESNTRCIFIYIRYLKVSYRIKKVCLAHFFYSTHRAAHALFYYKAD